MYECSMYAYVTVEMTTTTVQCQSLICTYRKNKKKILCFQKTSLFSFIFILLTLFLLKIISLVIIVVAQYFHFGLSTQQQKNL